MSRSLHIAMASVVGLFLVLSSESLGATILDDFSQFPFEERIDFETFPKPNASISVTQKVGDFTRSSRLGTINVFPREGSAVMGISGPDRSEFFVRTDLTPEQFFLTWIFQEPRNLDDVTAIEIVFGDVDLPNPSGRFRFALGPSAFQGRTVVDSIDFVDVLPSSSWVVDLSDASDLGLDLTSIGVLGFTTLNMKAGSSLSIREVRLIPEPCSHVLAMQIFVLLGLACSFKRN